MFAVETHVYAGGRPRCPFCEELAPICTGSEKHPCAHVLTLLERYRWEDPADIDPVGPAFWTHPCLRPRDSRETRVFLKMLVSGGLPCQPPGRVSVVAFGLHAAPPEGPAIPCYTTGFVTFCRDPVALVSVLRRFLEEK